MRSTTLLCSRLAFVALLTLLFAICVPSLLAQSAGTSGLTGTITDPSGAAIPNVTVTLTSNDTNQARTATTGADGQYKFTLLPPGSYKVRFSAMGFKTSEVGSVTLNVTENPNARSDAGSRRAIRAGDRGSTAETLQTSSSTLGPVVGSNTVTELPLANRNFTQIIGLSAGANVPVNNATHSEKAPRISASTEPLPGRTIFKWTASPSRAWPAMEAPTTAVFTSASPSPVRTRSRNSRSRLPLTTPLTAATPAGT